MTSLALLAVAALAANPTAELRTPSLELSGSLFDGQPFLVLTDLRDGRPLADGPTVYRASSATGAQHALQAAMVSGDGQQMLVTGQLAGLTVEQRFSVPAGRAYLEEQVTLANEGAEPVELTDLVIGLTINARAVQGDRFAAVPLRRRSDRAVAQDFSAAQILSGDGWEYRYNAAFARPKTAPAEHHFAEGWAWTRGEQALGVFSYCRDQLRWSVLAPERGGQLLRFGGLSMVSGQPDALTHLAPGQRLDLGFVRYQSLGGQWRDAAMAYRALLDEQGLRFPADFNPPVHWEQLYNMEGDWNDRPQRYTLDKLEAEAQLGSAYSCQALYLDPGWDTTFGSFLWGPWLGTPSEFVAHTARRHGLKVSLHCPMPPWASSPGMEMGPANTADWPTSARRTAPPAPEAPDHLRTPALRDGRRNLALLPAATARASSTIAGYAIHHSDHLIDGWAGNANSWVAADMPAWVEVDLGDIYRVEAVRLSNDQSNAYSDRQAADLTIRLASELNAWRTVASSTLPLTAPREVAFSPTSARWLRIEIGSSANTAARLDEVEVLEARRLPADEQAAWTATVRRGTFHAAEASGWGGREPIICMGSRQFLDEAERRLLALAEAGVAFFMFDGTWYGGACDDPAHGHPIPYRVADHLRTCLDLARRVKVKHPEVLIEMHDMLAGGDRPRMTPVYFGYEAGGRTYDDNWGFELMWDPMEDLRSGRAFALYDYNLGCNIPAYLHIDLRKDNVHCVELWWFASTCRHLGIGGTHPDPAVAAAQRAAMARYHDLQAFYKRGEFFGLDEQVHVHSLEGAAAINVFNLSDQPRTISASAPLAGLGIGPHAASDVPWATVRGDCLQVRVELPPWGTAVGAMR